MFRSLTNHQKAVQILLIFINNSAKEQSKALPYVSETKQENDSANKKTVTVRSVAWYVTQNRTTPAVSGARREGGGPVVAARTRSVDSRALLNTHCGLSKHRSVIMIIKTAISFTGHDRGLNTHG